MKTAIRTAITNSIVAGAITLASAAQASPIRTVELTFPGFPDLFPKGYKATTITYDRGDSNPTVNTRVAAGMFSGSASNGVNFDASTLLNSEDDVLAYCIDILNNLLRETSVYHVETIAEDQVENPEGVRRDFGRMLGFLGAVNHVASSTYSLSFGDKNWLNPNSNWMSAAIQVGIWESLYEQATVPLSTTSGWFEATSLNSEGNDFLSSAFLAMDTAAALSANQVRWLAVEGGQDLLVDPVDVPVPASLLLLLGGLGLLAFRRRLSDAV